MASQRKFSPREARPERVGARDEVAPSNHRRAVGRQAHRGGAGGDRVPKRQCLQSLPFPPRLLLAAQSKLVTPVLQKVGHPVITGFLLYQASLKAVEADSVAARLIQRVGSTADLNIHQHCLVLDCVFRCPTVSWPSLK